MAEPHGNRDDSAAPVTLHGVMQEALGGNLRAHYAADKNIPHSLLVLMMQIADPQERKVRAAKRSPRLAAGD